MSKPNGGKDKLTCTMWEKKSQWHMVQHMVVWKDNWMDSLESFPMFKSIGWSSSFCMGWSFYKYLFSKPSLGSLWQKFVWLKFCINSLRVLCFLYSIFFLFSLCSEIVVTQVSETWEKRENLVRYTWEKYHQERSLSW